MEQLQTECKQYLDGNYVFKRCSNVIIILKKPLINFQCNEMRQNVIDKNFAKFRCNGLITVDCIHIKSLLHIKSFHHRFYLKDRTIETIYEVGKMAIPDSYCEDIDLVCTSGIHYFLTLDAAFYYDNFIRDGKSFLFYDNGLKKAEWDGKDGNTHGIRTNWRITGKLYSTQEFKDGYPHGDLCLFDENGKLQDTIPFSNGNRVYF